MSSSSAKPDGDVEVRSKFGPIRIELLDDRLNRHALGFGELRARVPAGLYTLQYSAGTARDEEILRVEPGRTVTREVDLAFPAVAPISVSSTTHEFHTHPAQRISQQLKQNYGAGGGVMILARTIDADGMAPVPLEQLSLHDAELQPVGDLAADAERSDKYGWSCLSAHVNPGGYALRWRTPVDTRRAGPRGEARPVDQSLWVSAGWLTMVFIGYCSESGQLERQSASIHMARLGMGFQPGPNIWAIRNNQAHEWDLKEARINQTLDLALGGLRTGNQVVPDDLLDLLLSGKFQNPMLGIVGAHAILQRRMRDWKTFDLIVQNLENLIPGHPDVAALRLCGMLLREKESQVQPVPISWPPMLCTGYKGLIESDWKESGTLIVDESVAERAAAVLLPESPWTCWLWLEARTPRVHAPQIYPIPRAWPKIGLPDLSNYIQQAADPATALGRTVRQFAFPARVRGADLFAPVAETPDPAVARVSRHIAGLKEMGEEVDLSNLSMNDFRQLGLPVAAVEKAIQVLMDAAALETAVLDEAGRMELQLSDLDLPAALQNALTLIKERAQRHGIRLGLEIDPGLGQIRADERKFKQVILNLLLNAVKFTPEGGLVSVHAKPSGTMMEIAVSGTGPGIAPEDQAAVFEEFKQVGPDSARKAEGTGLGLTLTKKFIKLHGGEIQVDSAPGRGSTFTFTVPIRSSG